MRLRRMRRRRLAAPRLARSKYRHRETLGDSSGKESIQRILGYPVQAKLSIGQPNDKYEQEADRVADKVMSMPETSLQRVEGKDDEEQVQSKPLADQITPLVQRQADAPEDDQEEPVQAKETTGRTPQLPSRIESGINGLKSGGQPLDRATRVFFEPRFGVDLGDVRIHNNAQAGDMAKSIQARAFTTGNHVVMGQGEYSPESAEGRHLLAHELTHTVQQRASRDSQSRGDKVAQRMAYIETRSLGQEEGDTSRDWNIGFGNLKLNHRHIMFDHQHSLPAVGRQDNIGFHRGGLFSENWRSRGYTIRETLNDEARATRAVNLNPHPGTYNLITNNCQDWVTRVKNSYSGIPSSSGLSFGNSRPDGSVRYPDGSVIHPDGRMTLEPGPKW